jgi:hypothetical protein
MKKELITKSNVDKVIKYTYLLYGTTAFEEL